MEFAKPVPITWLKIVWKALDERDRFRRAKLLQRANTFLSKWREVWRPNVVGKVGERGA
jgi:hypothetical protein